MLLPMEGDRWILLIAGINGETAPTDDAGMLDYVRGFDSPVFADIIGSSEPLGEPVTHRFPANQRRHVESLRRFPLGWVLLGDSVCSFNPIYGQGMTSAAQQARALGSSLDRAGAVNRSFARTYFRAASRIVSTPWSIAVGGDFAYAGTTGKKPFGTDLLNHYMDRVDQGRPMRRRRGHPSERGDRPRAQPPVADVTRVRPPSAPQGPTRRSPALGLRFGVAGQHYEVTVWVVRHGCAGHKGDWDGDDDERPLDPAGVAQAEALAELLVTHAPRRLLSSPTRRCMDTMGPLAIRAGLPIDTDDRLCPQQGHEPLLDIIGGASSDGTVLCSHGEAMAPLLSEFRRRHLTVVDDVPESRLLLKGVAWELEIDGSPRVRLHAPVPLAECPKHPQG